jgi:hypothetical protein
MREQILLTQIDRLTNSIQKIEDTETKNEIAYFIHTLIDSYNIGGRIEQGDYNMIAHYSILANSDAFVKVETQTLERDCMHCEVTFRDDGTHDYCPECEEWKRAYSNK